MVEVRPQEVHFSLHPLFQCCVERGPIDLAEENVRLADAGEVVRPVEVTVSAVLEGTPVARGDDRLDDRFCVVVVDEVRLVADGRQHDLVQTVPHTPIHVVHERLGQVRVGEDRRVRQLILRRQVQDIVATCQPEAE